MIFAQPLPALRPDEHLNTDMKIRMNAEQPADRAEQMKKQVLS